MRRKSDELVLLITGCISPDPTQKFLKLTSPEVRLKQYIDCIEYYIFDSDFKLIVFCDNSNTTFDTSELHQMAKKNSKEIEILTFMGDTGKTIEKGKGFGEGEIIAFALHNSLLLRKAKAFAKVTGRLKIKNINTIIKNVRGGNFFNSDIYRIGAIDTRFYICDINYYNRYLRNVYENTSYEHSMALEDLFRIALDKNHHYKCTRRYPRFEGVSGGSGRNYSRENRCKLLFFDLLCGLGVFTSIYHLYSKSIIRKAIWHFWGRTIKV